MVYDCFQFFNELDILLLRMEILNDIVDKFVISESTVTFSGDPKPLFYQENQEMFAKFKDKIIHNVVSDTPMDCDAFTRDHHQKCAVIRGLSGAKDDDIVIFSDVDEIPNPKTLKKLLPSVEAGKIYMLAQRLFYCYLNMEEISGNLLSVTGEFPGVERKMWLGTKVCKKSLLEKYTTEELRNKEQQAIGVRVEDGGWHFSYMGGGKNQDVSDRVKYKIKSAAHQEYNNSSTLAHVKKNIQNMQDIFGRDTVMKQVEIDDSFPDFLRENIKDYEYLLYKTPKFYERFSMDLLVENIKNVLRSIRNKLRK